MSVFPTPISDGFAFLFALNHPWCYFSSSVLFSLCSQSFQWYCRGYGPGRKYGLIGRTFCLCSKLLCVVFVCGFLLPACHPFHLPSALLLYLLGKIFSHNNLFSMKVCFVWHYLLYYPRRYYSFLGRRISRHAVPACLVMPYHVLPFRATSGSSCKSDTIVVISPLNVV